MADVRALLQASRQQRRITHPFASYASDGKLICNLCETIIKHESAWQSHLHTSQHTLRQTRAQHAAAVTTESTPIKKKRKASDIDSPNTEDRKKAKPDVITSAIARQEDSMNRGESAKQGSLAKGQVKTEETVNIDDLDAFERELADLESTILPSRSTLNPTAVIVSEPKTAADIAAQAREEQSEQREKRDEELKLEKEDAADALQDELDQMESLEERVKTLRQRRDAVRSGTIERRQGTQPADLPSPALPDQNDQLGHGDALDEDDSEADDDYWNFGNQ